MLHSQLPNDGILENSCCNIPFQSVPKFQSVFPCEIWKMPHLSPQTSYTGKYCKLTKPLRENIASSLSQYRNILQAHGANTRKYWLVGVIENDCIVTRVGVYNEILPEPSGNPSDSGDISSYTPSLVTIQLQYGT